MKDRGHVRQLFHDDEAPAQDAVKIAGSHRAVDEHDRRDEPGREPDVARKPAPDGLVPARYRVYGAVSHVEKALAVQLGRVPAAQAPHHVPVQVELERAVLAESAGQALFHEAVGYQVLVRDPEAAEAAGYDWFHWNYTSI